MNSSLASQATAHLEELGDLAALVARDMAGTIAEVAEVVLRALEAGGKLLFCGNGGSAADAQHLATEYVVRFQRERLPVPAIALTTDTSLLTAAGNDLGFEHIFARQLRALGSPGDVLFLHSTTGESPNLLEAARVARQERLSTVALLARGGGRLRDLVDHALVIPTDNAAHAQELHLAVGHAICDIVDRRLAPPGGGDY